MFFLPPGKKQNLLIEYTRQLWMGEAEKKNQITDIN